MTLSSEHWIATLHCAESLEKLHDGRLLDGFLVVRNIIHAQANALSHIISQLESLNQTLTEWILTAADSHGHPLKLMDMYGFVRNKSKRRDWVSTWLDEKGIILPSSAVLTRILGFTVHLLFPDAPVLNLDYAVCVPGDPPFYIATEVERTVEVIEKKIEVMERRRDAFWARRTNKKLKRWWDDRGHKEYQEDQEGQSKT